MRRRISGARRWPAGSASKRTRRLEAERHLRATGPPIPKTMLRYAIGGFSSDVRRSGLAGVHRLFVAGAADVAARDFPITHPPPAPIAAPAIAACVIPRACACELMAWRPLDLAR